MMADPKTHNQSKRWGWDITGMMHLRKRRRRTSSVILRNVLIIVILLDVKSFLSRDHHVATIAAATAITNDPVTIEDKPSSPSQNECTPQMIDAILKNGMSNKRQSRPGHCEHTRCPDATWLETYYRTHVWEQQEKGVATKQQQPFLGISVGCNKGLDAVNTLRMGSNSERFSKEAWLEEMFDHHTDYSSDHELEKEISGNCGQGRTPSFPLVETQGERSAIVHCIEPIPATVTKLQSSASTLGWNVLDDDQVNQQGLVIAPYAISNEDETMEFPIGVNMGVESVSLYFCRNPVFRNRVGCQTVPVYTLDTYDSKFLNLEKNDQHIHVLSIDVEGFDFKVLEGASEVLPRTEYLEFEVHSKEPWDEQSLEKIIDRLDTNFGFTCYWAGHGGKLWRLNGQNCFLDHYEHKCWSNVACANRSLVPTLVEIMEQTFLEETLGIRSA